MRLYKKRGKFYEDVIYWHPHAIAEPAIDGYANTFINIEASCIERYRQANCIPSICQNSNVVPISDCHYTKCVAANMPGWQFRYTT
ncbi:MAG: hypothetical protein ACOYYS_10785 [Chloroflexota bacterium]